MTQKLGRAGKLRTLEDALPRASNVIKQVNKEGLLLRKCYLLSSEFTLKVIFFGSGAKLRQIPRQNLLSNSYMEMQIIALLLFNWKQSWI